MVIAPDERRRIRSRPCVGREEHEPRRGAGGSVLRIVTRPLIFENRIIQVGAFAGIASGSAAEARIPDMLRRADIAMDHARSGRVARPVWFDAGMERALIAQGEIEQGIRFGLEHGQFVPLFRAASRSCDRRNCRLRGARALESPALGIIGPDVFIPIAEEIGLIGRLSEQVIGEALREAASWDPTIKISVNISPFAARRRLACAAHRPAAHRDGLSGGAAGDRSHRELAVRRHRPCADDRHQPQKPGHPAGARRFRHRLLLACRTCARCRSTSSRSTAASSPT